MSTKSSTTQLQLRKSLSFYDRLKYMYAKNCVSIAFRRDILNRIIRWKSFIKCNQKPHTILHLEAHERKNTFHKCQERSASSKPINTSTSYTPNDLRESPTVDTVQTHFLQSKGTTTFPTALIDIKHALPSESNKISQFPPINITH